jgi:uncharacterized protein
VTEAELPGLVRQVLLVTFVLAAVFGAVAQRSHFCTMGAVSDLVLMGDSTRMRMWVVAMAAAILGFNAMVAFGWLKAGDSIYAAPRLLWLSHLVGGALFGLGMVLASGCGSKTLVRIGGGNLKSLVVFCVLAISAYATMRGAVAVARVASLDRIALELAAGQDLPSMLAPATGLAVPLLAGLLGGIVALSMFAWVLAKGEGRRAEVWWAGLVIGAVIVGVWWASGRLGHIAEHPATLEETFLATNTQRMESLTFVAPVAYTVDWLILFSDRSKVLTIGIVSVFGVVAGSAAMALATRSFRWEGFASTEDTALHLVGAVLMGVGGVTALGCTVGQGLTGLSTLAVGSVLTLLAILGGAVAALKWQMWRLERSI